MPLGSRLGVLSTPKHTPDFRAAAINTARAASSVTVPVPAGTVSGDLMLAVIAVAGTSLGGPVYATPAGWTLVDSTVSGSGWGVVLFRRVAGGSEPGTYLFTWSGGGSNVHFGVIASYVNPAATPIDVQALTAPGHDTTAPVTAPSVTTTGLAERLICFFVAGGTATWTDPAGMIRRYAATSVASDQGSVLIVDQLVSGASVTGAKTATRSTVTDQYEFGVSVALKAVS